MPEYAYICGGCQKTEDRVVSMSESSGQTCACGGHLYIDWTRHALAGPRPHAREWHGKESQSLSMAFDPRHIDKLKKGVPSAELHPDGSLKFNSDKHQRQVYKEMGAEMKRIEQRDLERTGASHG